jgi:hypothetical protein
MAQVDELDEGLEQLAQLFADVGLVVNIMRERIAGVDRLREPFQGELEALQGLINQVLPLLSGDHHA